MKKPPMAQTFNKLWRLEPMTSCPTNEILQDELEQLWLRKIALDKVIDSLTQYEMFMKEGSRAARRTCRQRVAA
jgi:hypothetical protein